ncbi:MAG: hypothetical protein ACRDGR_03460 [bacterium]
MSDWTADPQLCARGFGSFDVRNTSPCLPANNACGAVIGNVEMGCAADPIVLEMRSWGRVKTLYRK